MRPQVKVRLIKTKNTHKGSIMLAPEGFPALTDMPQLYVRRGNGWIKLSDLIVKDESCGRK